MALHLKEDEVFIKFWRRDLLFSGLHQDISIITFCISKFWFLVDKAQQICICSAISLQECEKEEGGGMGPAVSPQNEME